MIFLVIGRSAEYIAEKKKTGRRQTLKSNEKEKRRIRGKSNNKVYIFGFKLYFAQKHFAEKKLFIPLYHQIVFTVFMRCRIFETHY